MNTEYLVNNEKIELNIDIVRNFLVPSDSVQPTDQEVVMFINLCKYQKLNPFIREAYLVKYKHSSPATLIVGKDVFTKRAFENPNFDGLEAGIIVQNNNKEIEYRDGSLKIGDEKIIGGWAKVYHKNFKIPFKIAVSLSEYEGKNSFGEVTKMWKSKPATMIRKVALSQALKEAFPKDFQGLYDAAEMNVEIDHDIPKIETKEIKTIEKPSINEDIVDKIMNAKERKELENLFKSIPKDQQSLYLEIFKGRAKEIDTIKPKNDTANLKNDTANEPINDTAKVSKILQDGIMTKEELKLTLGDDEKLNLNPKKLHVRINKLKALYPEFYSDMLDKFDTNELELSVKNYEYVSDFLTQFEEAVK